jgi:hypothetical protein
VDITLIHSEVRSLMIIISVCKVITCGIMGALLLNKESIIILFNQSDMKYLIEIYLMEIDYSKSLAKAF